MVFGPVVHHLASLDSINTSNERIVALVQGKWKDAVPDTGVFAWVDVRDVALAHVLAIEKPALGGKRLFATAGYFSNRYGRTFPSQCPELYLSPQGREECVVSRHQYVPDFAPRDIA